MLFFDMLALTSRLFVLGIIATSTLPQRRLLRDQNGFVERLEQRLMRNKVGIGGFDK